MHGPITQVGGKNRLAKIIIALFPSHRCYVEPFAGGAQVFYHKPLSDVEVLNDLDGDTINFFRVCQSHPDELIRCLRYHLASRRWFELLKNTDPETQLASFISGRLPLAGESCIPLTGMA